MEHSFSDARRFIMDIEIGGLSNSRLHHISYRRDGMKLSAIAVLGIVCLFSLALPLAYASGGDDAKSGAMKSVYFLETRHTPEQCLEALDAVGGQPKLIGKVEWGCMAGDHAGYAFIEGANEAAVRKMLPEVLRADAKIVKVDKFTTAQIKSFHEKKK